MAIWFNSFTTSSILKSLFACLIHLFPQDKNPFFPYCPRGMDCLEGIFRVSMDANISFSGIMPRLWWGLPVQPFVPKSPQRGPYSSYFLVCDDCHVPGLWSYSCPYRIQPGSVSSGLTGLVVGLHFANDFWASVGGLNFPLSLEVGWLGLR